MTTYLKEPAQQQIVQPRHHPGANPRGKKLAPVTELDPGRRLCVPGPGHPRARATASELDGVFVCIREDDPDPAGLLPADLLAALRSHHPQAGDIDLPGRHDEALNGLHHTLRHGSGRLRGLRSNRAVTRAIRLAQTLASSGIRIAAGAVSCQIQDYWKCSGLVSAGVIHSARSAGRRCYEDPGHRGREDQGDMFPGFLTLSGRT
jgi:hypothetical protein